MLKKLPTLLIWVFAVGLQIQLVYIFMQPKDVVIDIEKVFNEFELKKELEQKASRVELAQKSVLDSLELNLQAIENRYKLANEEEKPALEKEYNQYRFNYSVRKKKMEENLALALGNFDEQIWNQLNAYISDFGKEQGARIVFGNFNKNVVYFDAEMDQTEKAIAIINNRYKGN